MRTHKLVGFGFAVACSLVAAAAFGSSGVVTVTSTNYSASVAKSLTLSFSDHANSTNGLWVAWDDQDRGSSTNGWANVKFVRTVLPDLLRAEYTLPSGWGDTGKKALRFFLCEVPADVDYTLDSITSTGTQYLAFPDYKLSGNSRVEMEVMLNQDITGTHPLFCSRQGVDTNQFTLFILKNSGNHRWRFDYYWTGSKKTCSEKPVKATRYAIAASSDGLFVGGEKVQDSPSVRKDFTCDGPLTVLAHHGGDVTKTSGRSQATLYSFKVSDATCLNLIPAVKAGVVGVCDLVSGQFFGPSGTGSFTPGGRIESETPFFAVSDVVGPIPNLEGALVFKTNFEISDSATYDSGVAGVKQGDGMVTLTGANNFGGSFTVDGGVLAADFGQGLGTADNLKLVSGCYAPLCGTITAALGLGAGEINLAGGAVGFSAVNGDLNVNFGGEGADVTLGTAEPTAASSIILNDARGTHTLTLANRIVTESDCTIDTQAGRAVLLGGAAVGGLMKTGEGTLEISGAELKVDGDGETKIMNGTMKLVDNARLLATNNLYVGRGSTPTSDGQLIVTNSVINLGSTGSLCLQAGTQKSDDDVRAMIYDGADITVKSVNVSRGELRMYGGIIKTDKNEHGIALGGLFEACRLFGGTLVTRDVRINASSSAFEWRGGTVRAMESRNDFFDNFASKVRIGKEGGAFETPKDVRLSIGRVVDQVPGEKPVAYSRDTAMTVPAFRKIGLGTLGMACKNKYLCATEVNEGILKLWSADAVPTNGLLRLTGGTLWLNGYNQSISNLVGTGTIQGGGTLTVKGELVPTGALAINDGAKIVAKVVIPVKDDGSIDGSLSSKGTLDLSDIDLVLENADKLPSDGRITLATANAISGTFKSVTGLPSDWRMNVTAKKVTITNRGMVLFLK